MSLAMNERAGLTSLAHQHDNDPAKEGDLRIWWVPQVPGKSFHWPVPSLEAASMLTDALASYDAFQLIHNIKGDYCNTGGLQVFEDGEWVDWYDEETGDDFDDWRSARRAA